MMQHKRWTRSEKWTAIGVLVAILLGIGSFFVPEVRRALGVARPAPVEHLPVQQNTAGAGSVAVNGNGNTVSTTVTNGENK